MRGASQAFYLAVFSLLGSSHADSPGAVSKSKPTPSNVCEFEPGAVVSDACASYHTLERLNEAIHPYLHGITTGTDFFSHYRLNLFNKRCPFWDDENGVCGNKACAVNTLDNETDIPLIWRAAKLGALEGPTASHPGRKEQKENKQRPLHGSLGADVDESCVVEYDDECDDRDYCVPDDEGATAKGDYVSLVDNPERYTGYAGVGAQQVWQAIYRENCFSKEPKNAQSGMSSPFGNQQQAFAANQLRNVMKQQGVQQNMKSAIAHGQPTERLDPVEFDDTCVEKRVFHRVISGMHASISAHLCAEYLNKSTGKWEPNVSCYEERLHKFPERVSNIYFNYALVMRAVGKIKNHMQKYTFCSYDPEEDRRTKALVVRLSESIPSGVDIFDETVMFQDPGSAVLKEDFRHRFRNVSRIMDCVGCDKCRLWGKVQTAGYGTALKVLFEFDEEDPSKDPPLRRTELVALLNTMDRLSHSLKSIQDFREEIEKRDHIVSPAISDPKTEEEVRRAQEILKTKEGEDGFEEKKEDATPDFRRNWDSRNMTIWDEFKAELSLVTRVFIYVMKSWANLPQKFAKILLFEMYRLWNYWVGLTIPERSWEIRIPHRDEF